MIVCSIATSCTEAADMRGLTRSCIWSLLLAAQTAWCSDDQYDVVVVGLGASGLAALTRLAEKGYKVIGLEAMDRIGGRVNTREFAGGLVEFGAEWIHGENPTYELARKHNVSIKDSQMNMGIATNGNYNQTLLKEVLDFYIQTIMANTTDVGTDERMKLGDHVRNKFNQFLSKNPGVAENKDFTKNALRLGELMYAQQDAFDNWNEISLRGEGSSQLAPGSQAWSWHKFGYKTLFEILLHRYNDGTPLPVDMRLNSVVTSVEWSTEGVKVTAAGQVHRARAAIITVSLGVLKHSHTKLFSPPLPAEKQRAIEAITLGTVDKVCLQYDVPWWGANNTRMFLWTDDELSSLPAEDWWVAHIASYSMPESNPHVLTLWATGAAARHMETLDINVVRRKVEQLLRRFCGDVPPAKDIERSRWFSNPYTRGSYSYRGVATDDIPNVSEDLAKPAGALYFVGEATSARHYSTVHGALETGWAAADSIIDAFKKGTTASAA